jgi:ring-1,2-phenylacetyl-CoA epoxidase subunit PaaE
MGLFKNIFKKEDAGNKTPKGFHTLQVAGIERLTADSVKVTFEVPAELKSTFQFTPGQYLNLCVDIDGKEERRSYSICSAPSEPLSVAIKGVEGGRVSSWATQQLAVGDAVLVAHPFGNFLLEDQHKTVVAFAAGSGITPILSMAKVLNSRSGKIHLFYGNRKQDSMMFHADLTALENVNLVPYLSAEILDGYKSGRLDKEAISNEIKANLSLLKADAFFLCGPEEMIKDGIEVLALFGVPKEKVHYELFTTPVLMEQQFAVSTSDFTGESKVTVILDDEQVTFGLNSDGKTILDAVNKEGYDAPYSCRGGVCSTCKAKVLKGKATMTLNYSLTDQEVQDGFILTCQAHPASEELTVSYDV